MMQNEKDIYWHGEGRLGFQQRGKEHTCKALKEGTKVNGCSQERLSCLKLRLPVEYEWY